MRIENIIDTHTIEVRNGATLAMHTYEVTDLSGTNKSTMYYWYMMGKGTTHGIWTPQPVMCERVHAHWNGYAGFLYENPEPAQVVVAPTSFPKVGYQFDKWKEVRTMINAAKEQEMKDVSYDGGFLQFHWHGFVTCVNDERVGEAECFMGITKKALTDAVDKALQDHPNSKIEISLEGHWDWYPNMQALKYREYDPTDNYIDIVLYRNF